MMRTISKPAFLICLLTLLLCGCAAPPSATESSPAKADVRQPKGNPEVFWNKFSWSDLTAAEQELWGTLGWDQDSWDGHAPAPLSENMEWGELSAEERTAAEQLGYSRFYWDSN
ncbi:MAG: hypothetical protein JSW39_00590 [Desulfobacterales bacterium]|nr:MAG: hypothetical protein JSW39_00590 [Desulfobacterales bacterium]